MKPCTKLLTKFVIADQTVCSPSQIPSIMFLPILTSQFQPALRAFHSFSGKPFTKSTTAEKASGIVCVKNFGRVTVKNVFRAFHTEEKKSGKI